MRSQTLRALEGDARRALVALSTADFTVEARIRALAVLDELIDGLISELDAQRPKRPREPDDFIEIYI